MARKARPHLKSVYHLSQRPHSCLPLHAISIAPSSLAIVVVRIPSLLRLINISVTGTYNLIGRDAECASGFSVAHAHASLNTSSPSYASRPKSAICASVYRRYLYHQCSPPWCCHILTFAMTEKVSSRSHSGRPGVGVAPVLLPTRWKYPSSIAYYIGPTYSSCEHYRLAAYMRSRLGDPSRSHKLNG